jgi:hypothetical protein
MEGKTKMKIGYFIKEKKKNKTETSNFINTAKKLQNTSHTELNKEKNKIAHHKLALTHDISTPRTV